MHCGVTQWWDFLTQLMFLFMNVWLKGMHNKKQINASRIVIVWNFPSESNSRIWWVFAFHCFCPFVCSPFFVFAYCVEITCRKKKVRSHSFRSHLVYLHRSKSSVFTFCIFAFHIESTSKVPRKKNLLHWKTCRVGKAQFFPFMSKIHVDF